MERLISSEVSGALKELRGAIPEAAEALSLGLREEIGGWVKVLDGKLLPMLSPDFPLMAAICGGGSSGKSTLFNSLLKERISPTGGRAGINRRVLAAASEKHLKNEEFLRFLFEPFASAPEPLKDKSELTEPGPPVYAASREIPDNLVLMDTPDFDTGAKGEYVNRELARNALETADILIYIFTNSNYNNRDNTDFIQKMLTRIGKRRCFLVYRVYASFSSEEVVEHAMTVARNLYGEDAQKYLLGIYRAEEDNAVAAGEKFMRITPVMAHAPPFLEALDRIDPRKQRRDLIESILSDVHREAGMFKDRLAKSKTALKTYLDALQAAQSLSVQEALAHFPMDRVMKRFAEIWLETDPGHIKAMRKTGEVVGFPFKMVMGAAKWARRKFSEQPADDSTKTSYKDKVEEDLLTAVNSLYRKVLASELTVELAGSDPAVREMKSAMEQIEGFEDAIWGEDRQRRVQAKTLPESGMIRFTVPAHPSLSSVRRHMEKRDWRTTVQNILKERETIISITTGIENELAQLVETFRQKMGLWEKSRQTFSALLNVVPATVAVTYILATGDPVGATGIKVKLSGLFGLHDLYALVAIPATTGLNKADRNQLEILLGPIAKTWLDSKLETVRDIFEKHITREIFESGDRLKGGVERVLIGIDENVATISKALEA